MHAIVCLKPIIHPETPADQFETGPLRVNR